VSKQEGGEEVPWKRGIPEGRGGERIEDSSRPRRAKWNKPSRSVEGRITERKILKARGAKVHPISGAGKIKDDGSDSEAVYEVKDAVKTYTIKASEMRGLRRRAVMQGKQGVLLIKFPGFVMECFIKPNRDWEDE
jgi:hypothetical protein